MRDLTGSVPGAPAQGLADYVAMLRRRWWVVAQAACVFLALAAGLVVLVPEKYASFVVVNVTSTGVAGTGGQSSSRNDINLQTESQRVKSLNVAQIAARALKTEKSPKELSRQITVTVPNDSTVLYLTCTAPEPIEARDCAQAFGQAYLSSRTDSALKVINPQLQTLETQIANITREWSAEKEPQQKSLLFSQLQSLTDQLSTAKITAANITPGEIITDALLTADPVDPRPGRYLPSGLAVGLLVGVIAAILLERLDRRVHSAGDLERRLGLVAAFALPPARRGAPPLGLLSARHRQGQAFHELAHAIATSLGTGSHVVMVAGAATGAGAGAVAANTAAALARIGWNTVLITADLEAGSGHTHLGRGGEPGLAELLLGKASLREVTLRTTESPALTVIGPGQAVERAVDLLQSIRLDEVLVRLREKVDYVVIEAPSAALGADAQAIAARSDGALIVVETHRAKLGHVTDALRQVDRVGAPLLGLVTLPEQPRPKPSATAPADPKPTPNGTRAPLTSSADDHPVQTLTD
ncbi:Wzz/FepE/Etk N-terminal domain-containing protein [Actinocorallia sp. API 0066]|uniref:Wzz/FepE/Etk N-terminal domain-containing protein n=1 Tax=Actinocorallia sp. API 0066 TaxID=2896846 RepID=UPI001E6494F9|nr:Wzz/FepE/Etk N-terminal domain-containing protein [Actinocorallia sp. API 0066]MCD0447811.1 Wzz/FepE/Etk N-terminal domain-containing protein [Actinocorallia sp. API 0066]